VHANGRSRTKQEFIMSRRSILLATTVFAAIVSLTAVDPASAFGGRGGFGGGFGGGLARSSFGGFGRSPSLAAREFGGRPSGSPSGVIGPERSPYQSFNAATRQEPAQADGRSGYTIGQHPFDGRFIQGSMANRTAPDIAAIVAAHRTAENIQGAQGSGAPSVTAGGYVFGPRGQQNGSNQTIPGVDNSKGGAVGLNVTGRQDGQQRTPGSIPGIDNSMGGGSSLNLPGSNNQQNGLDAANQAIAKLVGKENNPIDKANQGGVNSLNTPSSVGSSTTSTDNTDNSKKTGNSSNNNSGNNNSGNQKTGSQPNGTNLGTPGGDSNTKTTTWISADGSTNTQSVTYDNKGRPASATGSTASPDGTTTTSFTTFDKNGNASKVVVGPISTRKGGTPSDNDSGTATAGDSLDARSSYAARNRGGGTDNGENSAGTTGGLSPSSPTAKTTYGDGGGNDAGDNNSIGKGGTLATGSSLTSKDQGDGGSSDSRGGAGTSTTTGTAKVVNPGGGHNQLTATTTKMN
jgi:hypothetical protein